MNNAFEGCNSLISLPDILKWNISNAENKENLFSGCLSLISFPNIIKTTSLYDNGTFNAFD